MMDFVSSITLLFVVKIMIVVLLGVYSVFAGLMMRQISMMTKAVTMKDDFIIRVIGIVHFAFALVVFLMALFIL